MRVEMLLPLAMLVAALSQAPSPPVLDFPATCAAPAHQRFVQGVIKLHNSAYDEAAEHFRAAQQSDPKCVMAYWGEAMTFNHPFWGEQDIGGGRRALAKLGNARVTRSAKAATSRERAYINAVEILYGDGDKDARDFRYAEAMAKVAFDNPSDFEAAAFYAAAILATVRLSDTTLQKQESAAALLKAILDKFPAHPGGLHYLIHACDHPEKAQLGLEAARQYEKVADENFHALHMPAHIYVQLGMWTDVVRSNEVAFAASDRYVKRNRLSLSKRDYHSLDWLQYGELQLGQYRKARSRTDIMLDSARQAGVAGMTGVAAEMAARFAVETEQWDALAGFPQTSRSAKLLFAQGLSSVRTGDLLTAKKAVSGIEAVVQQLAGNGQAIRSEQAETLKKELLSEIAFAEKRFDEAERLAEEALEIEMKLRVPSILEQGGILKPALEFYGEMLLKLKKPAEAAEHFAASLRRTPKRALSLLGLARSRAALNVPTAVHAYRELATIWANADPNIPALREAKEYLGIQP
jgi:tetratricopeptide (TPR) repeat protein